MPLAAAAAGYLRTRTVDTLSAISLILIVLGLIGSVLSGSSRFILAKESVLSGVFGLIYLGSPLRPRPLAFYMGRQFATGGDPERVAWWDSLWQYPDFRRVQRIMTAVWAAALIGDAGARLVLVFTLPTRTVLWLAPAMLSTVIVVTILWTISYGRRSRDRALAEHGVS